MQSVDSHGLELIIPPLNAESINLLTNYTTNLQTKNTIIDTFTDGTLTITEGRIMNITDPTATSTPGESQRAVSKNYVDNATSSISIPLNSVQKSSGSSFLGSNGLLYLGPSVGLKVNDKVSYGNGSGTIFSNNILNTSATVILPSDGATLAYTYFSNLKSITLSTTNSSNALTAANVVNNSFTRTSTAVGIIQDIMPSPVDVIALIPGAQIGSSFTFIYKYYGIQESILLYGRFQLKGNFLIYNNGIEVVTVPNKSIYKILGYVESLNPPLVTYYVLNEQSLDDNNQQITPIGLITDNFKSYLNTINDTNIIYPLSPIVINSTGAVTYTASNIKGLLITRTGLTGNSIDILPTGIGSSFPLGSGLVSFTVQNVSSYSLVVGSGSETGVTYGAGSRSIASSSVGTFNLYINTVADTYTVYSTGITSMNGV
jgi:hypothetical protein